MLATSCVAPPVAGYIYLMRSWAFRIIVLLACLFGLEAGAVSASGARLGENGSVTRFVVDLSEPVAFQVKTLGDPDRAVLLLPEMRWSLSPGVGQDGLGIVKGFRVHVTELGSSVVLDLLAPASVDAFLLPPQDGAGSRLVLDLTPMASAAESGTAIASAQAAPAVAAVMVLPPPPMAKPRGKRLIVLDPGHGGVDPGAIGASGIYEKEITLAVALEMRRKLQATGRYSVLMTRSTDVFLPLDERVRVAREAEADLFVSIHADSLGSKNHRGGTVYTLSQTASDKEAEALAARENKADIIAGVNLLNQPKEVLSILIDLAQRESMNLSAQFAQILTVELRNRVAMNRNSHRFAGFRVLTAPDMPSVLVELGYLSNEKDEAVVRSRAGQAKFADALVDAVDRYFAAGRR